MEMISISRIEYEEQAFTAASDRQIVFNIMFNIILFNHTIGTKQKSSGLPARRTATVPRCRRFTAAAAESDRRITARERERERERKNTCTERNVAGRVGNNSN